jgi:hypothetical protein
MVGGKVQARGQNDARPPPQTNFKAAAVPSSQNPVIPGLGLTQAVHSNRTVCVRAEGSSVAPFKSSKESHD